MQKMPHQYAVSALASPGGNIDVSSPGLPHFAANAPTEFDGPGDCWSPETLLVAAVANCFILSFRAVAAASNVSWTSLDCSAVGTLDRIDRVTRFTRVDVSASLVVGAGTSVEAAERALEKAHGICFISNSLNAECVLEARVETPAGETA